METEILEKAEIYDFNFNQNIVKLYQWGNGDKYVLLSHGWESNAGSLGAFVNPFVEQGFKVVSFDNPAHGSSEGTKANMLIFKELIHKIIEEFGMPEVTVGHSLGANVLILLSYQKNIEFKKTVLISPFNQMNSIFKGFQNIVKFPDSLYNEMISLAEERIDIQLRDLEFGDLGNKTSLNNILLMHDIGDKITPVSHSESMNEQWERLKFIPIEGSGHYKILWKKEVIQNALEFSLN
jgi:pimeloyl-ACP methyl ester carboxylesterase